MDCCGNGNARPRMQRQSSATSESTGRLRAAKKHRQVCPFARSLRAARTVRGVLARRNLSVLCVVLVALSSLRTTLAEDPLLVSNPQLATILNSVPGGSPGVAECIANCAIDPTPDYTTCVKNCWGESAELAIRILRTLAPLPEFAEVDPEQLDRALGWMSRIDTALAANSNSRQLVDDLGQLFAENWGNGLFRLYIDFFYLEASKQLAGLRQLDQTMEREKEVIDMLLSFVWDEKIMSQASRAGQVGMLAMLPEDTEGRQDLLNDWSVSASDLEVQRLVDTIMEPPISLSAGAIPFAGPQDQVGSHQGVLLCFIEQFKK